jgi:putative methionine-R-sulfoxide reductase with GAF domain
MHAGSPNPSQAEWGSTEPDRRRHPRLRPTTASYAVGDTVLSGRVAELNEILDISEDGMGIQALWPLIAGHTAEFRLDLSNPNTYAEVKGTVVWGEQSGRAGIRFAEMSASSRRELSSWLWANQAVAEELPAVSAEPVPEPIVEQPEDDPLLCEEADAGQDESLRNTDYTSVLDALDAIRREVIALGRDQEAALQLIARRAQVFTCASAVAIALSDGSQMTCRATAGSDAPPIGAHLQIGSGFSGECVRTGALLHCRDAETDPLVDRGSCRALGIRSMVAVPIRSSDEVIGLLEVFSPDPKHFSADDETVLQRLAALLAVTVQRAAQEDAGAPPNASVDDEFPVETPADLPIPQFSPSRNGLLISAAITVLIAVFWLIGTWDNKHSATPPPFPSQQQSLPHPDPLPQANAQASDVNLDQLRQLAEQGDSAAQLALGTRYASGQEVPQDYTAAARWFTQAAEQGSVIAQSALAAYYSSGRGVPQDSAKAYFWSLVARARGDETSKSRIPALESHLNPSAIAAEQQQAAKWLQQHPAVPKDTPATE